MRGLLRLEVDGGTQVVWYASSGSGFEGIYQEVTQLRSGKAICVRPMVMFWCSAILTRHSPFAGQSGLVLNPGSLHGDGCASAGLALLHMPIIRGRRRVTE